MEETILRDETFYVSKTDRFERDEIVVFKIYTDNYAAIDEQNGTYQKEWQQWFKRLIAFSGDSIFIKDGDVFVNNRRMPDPPLSLSEYDLLSRFEIDDFPERDEYQVRLQEKRGDTFHFVATLTKEQAENYSKRKPAIYSVIKKVVEYEPMDTSVVRPCHGCQWTVDNFGPLKIPAPGDTISVDRNNYNLFRNIPGIQMGKFVIKEKLYFVMGDNRHYSMDSRHTGYISHSKMIGIVK